MRMRFFSICRTNPRCGLCASCFSYGTRKLLAWPKNVLRNKLFELLLPVEGSSGPRALPRCGAVEQLTDFLILRRRKILVPLADSEEWNGSHRAHDVVHLMAQFFAGGFRSHGHGRNDLCRLPLT